MLRFGVAVPQSKNGPATLETSRALAKESVAPVQNNHTSQFNSSLGWEGVLALVGREIARCCRPSTLRALLADISRNHGGVLILAWVAQGLRDVQRQRGDDNV